jgi:hypothetical protein
VCGGLRAKLLGDALLSLRMIGAELQPENQPEFHRVLLECGRLTA